MRERDTKGQTEPVFDLYKDNLEDVIDSYINDGVLDRNNSLQLSKPSASALWLEKLISLLSQLLSNGIRIISSKNNNSSILLWVIYHTSCPQVLCPMIYQILS